MAQFTEKSKCVGNVEFLRFQKSMSAPAEIIMKPHHLYEHHKLAFCMDFAEWFLHMGKKHGKSLVHLGGVVVVESFKI